MCRVHAGQVAGGEDADAPHPAVRVAGAGLGVQRLVRGAPHFVAGEGRLGERWVDRLQVLEADERAGDAEGRVVVQ